MTSDVSLRSKRGIRIRKLRLVGPTRNYEISFVGDNDLLNSLSVIAGAISTGKTTVLEFIDYCLGASDHPHHPEVMGKVTSAIVEVELSGVPHTIERQVGEPSSHAMIRSGRLGDRGGPPPERRPIRPPGSPDSLSNLLLTHCGLEGVQLREAPTQDSSGTDPLSFRDLMWLCFLPNEQVASKNLIFENHVMKKIKLRQVIDVIFDVHDDRSADLGRRIKELEGRLTKARAAYTAAQNIVDEQQLGSRMQLEIAREDAIEEMAAVEAALEVLNQRVSAATTFAESVRQRHREAGIATRRAVAFVRDRETQLRRMIPLRAQYAQDVTKLTMLAEAHRLFDPLHVRVCPACLSSLGEKVSIDNGACGLCHNPIPEGTADLTLGDAAPSPVSPEVSETEGSSDRQSTSDTQRNSATLSDADFDVSTELRATKMRLSEVTKFIDDLDSELRELQLNAATARDVEAQTAAEVDNVTRRAISPFIAERDLLSSRRQEAATAIQQANTGLQMVSSLERRASDISRQEVSVIALRNELGDATIERTDRAAVIRRISERFATILAAWRYPKLSDAYLNDELAPFVRNLRYTSASSGGRTLISLAWTLAIFQVAWETGGSHPGFLFIDSPQKNLGQTGERDTEFADAVTISDFYKHLHAWLAGPGAGAQIIIADNAPPLYAEDNIVVRYSGREALPPYGLIDDATA